MNRKRKLFYGSLCLICFILTNANPLVFANQGDSLQSSRDKVYTPQSALVQNSGAPVTSESISTAGGYNTSTDFLLQQGLMLESVTPVKLDEKDKIAASNKTSSENAGPGNDLSKLANEEKQKIDVMLDAIQALQAANPDVRANLIAEVEKVVLERAAQLYKGDNARLVEIGAYFKAYREKVSEDGIINLDPETPIDNEPAAGGGDRPKVIPDDSLKINPDGDNNSGTNYVNVGNDDEIRWGGADKIVTLLTVPTTDKKDLETDWQLAKLLLGSQGPSFPELVSAVKDFIKSRILKMKKESFVDEVEQIRGIYQSSRNSYQKDSAKADFAVEIKPEFVMTQYLLAKSGQHQPFVNLVFMMSLLKDENIRQCIKTEQSIQKIYNRAKGRKLTVRYNGEETPHNNFIPQLAEVSGVVEFTYESDQANV